MQDVNLFVFSSRFWNWPYFLNSSEGGAHGAKSSMGFFWGQDSRNNTRAKNRSNPQAKITMMATDTKEGKDFKESKPRMPKSPNQGQKPLGECLYCKKPHDFEKCFKFKGLEIKDKVEFGSKEKLCFNCLKKGHRSSNCHAYPTCMNTGCKGKHHTYFHDYTGDSSPSESSATGSSSSPCD